MDAALDYDDRMSDVDRIMWVIEKNPHLRSTITAITLLDGTPARDRVIERVDRASRRIPRLRQRVVWNPYSVAPPRWEYDPHFDLSYHLRFARAPKGSMQELLKLTEPIAMQGFDRDRALWEFLFVDGLRGGRSALVTKVHHALTDGMGAIRLMLELLDLEAEPSAPVELPDEPQVVVLNQAQRLRNALAHEMRRQRDMMALGVNALDRVREDPVESAREVRELVASMTRLAGSGLRPLSPVMRDRSLSASLSTLQADVAQLKAAAARAEAKVNDAFIVAMLRGVSEYHRAMGSPVERLRMGMPVNRRNENGADRSGNVFVPLRFEVPVNVDDPIEHMRAVRALIADQRAEPALSLVEPFAGLVSRLPKVLLTNMFAVGLSGQDINLSNVPGVDFPVYFEGSRVQAQYPIGPLSGAAINVTLLSYLGTANLGINFDPAAVTDRKLFLKCLRRGLDDVLRLAA